MRTSGIILSVIACLLTVSSVSARTWYIKANGTGDVPTIQAGVDSASTGDTLLCAAGTYSWSNQGTGTDNGMIYILRGSVNMVIKSESGASATFLDGQFQGRIIFFQGETELTIEGFTFRRGEAPSLGSFTGGAFAAHLSSPIVRDCVFRNNRAQSQGGAYWYGGQGSPLIENCLFENNTAAQGGAVFLINSLFQGTMVNCTLRNNTATANGGAFFSYRFNVSIMDCLFTGNSASSSGGAIEMQRGHPSSMVRSTIAGNDAPTGAGMNIVGASPLTVSNVIVAFSFGGGVGVNVDATSSAVMDCTDLWGNAGGDWVGSIAAQLGVSGNISGDPLFCSGGYLLQGNSPCAPGNHPDGAACGVIGVYPVGCGAVAVEHRSWGQIKSMYADE